MKNFSEWNDIKIETDQKESHVRIREGEIRWCRIGLNVGNEIVGKGQEFIRPVLVLKKFSGDVFLGIPLTSKNHRGNWYYALNHKESRQTVILNQARLLDRKRLQNKIFEISEKELVEIKQSYCNLILD